MLLSTIVVSYSFRYLPGSGDHPFPSAQVRGPEGVRGAAVRVPARRVRAASFCQVVPDGLQGANAGVLRVSAHQKSAGKNLQTARNQSRCKYL